MTLADEAKQILDNFDATSSEKIVSVLENIKSNMKSQLTQEYLTGKIDGVKSASSEGEKKDLCKNLKPYLDWQIQGN